VGVYLNNKILAVHVTTSCNWIYFEPDRKIIIYFEN
jgi:hypothetical protein